MQAAGSLCGAERVTGQPQQEQLLPSAAAPEAAAAAASGARSRAGWLLRQRQSPQSRTSPTAVQLQTSEIVHPDTSVNQAMLSSLEEQNRDSEEPAHNLLGRGIALRQLGAQFSQQQELGHRTLASQHEPHHLPQMRDTAGNFEPQRSGILVAEAAPLDEAQTTQQAQDETIIAARVRRLPQSDSPSGSAGSTRSALDGFVRRAAQSAPSAADRASVPESSHGVGDVHGADASLPAAASHSAAGELLAQ